MRLRDYIAHQGRGAKRALAQGAGLRWQTVHLIAEGRAVPRPSTARAIERATGGIVTAAELLGVAPTETTTDAADAAE